ncbi:putative type IX secretion system sortase PorU2 [Hymenobacter daeguensis]
MDKHYKQLSKRWLRVFGLLGLLLSGALAHAQSGPVGNEWIVSGQQYYKVKIVKDGLYKLDYQYLTQAGITGVAPRQLQIWRRGREIARYVGGNANVLDPTSFVEFYAIRNDGKLDVEMYRRPQDQGHQYYSIYTDTAAYFITWSVGSAARDGRAMTQPTAAGGALHPHRLTTQVQVFKQKFFYDPPVDQYIYMPWLEPAEGYYGFAFQNDGSFGYTASDSLVRGVAPTGPAPSMEILAFGANSGAHATRLIAVNGGVPRQIGTMQWAGRQRARQTFPLLRSDVNNRGQVYVGNTASPLSPTGDNYNIGYFKITFPQLNRWFSNRHSVVFYNDSLLASTATYEYANDSIPATVVGFDVQDIYNVQRIVSAPTGTARRYVFPSASTTTRKLLLADEAYLAVPPVRAKRVVFRNIAAATPNFIIITHPQLMRPDPATPGVTNAAREYANYRASVAGGRYDTLMVTAPQLYDQFTYGDRSWLALRHFSRWLVAAAPAATNRYLLLLGKGIQLADQKTSPGQSPNFRDNGELGLDLVPASSRAVSDNMISADIDNNNWYAKLHTGRLTVTTPHQIMSYLAKVKTHDALPPAAWRKNVLHLVGGYTAQETADFRSYMDAEKIRVERPYLGGHVETAFRVTPNNLPVSIDISAQLNAGLSLISYFGHGAPDAYALNFGKPSTSSTYNNTGRYPFLFLNGCSSNNSFSTTPTVIEDWLFAEQKGAIGSLGTSDLSFEEELRVAQDSLYKILFNEPAWFGKPITVAHDEAVRRLQRSPLYSSNLGIEQLLCTGWQGDPTLALFAPAQPDFVASAATLAITPTPGATPPTVRADSPDFILNVGVSNPGRITYDPVEIQVTRIFPSASGIPNQVYPVFTFRQSWQPDTTYALTLTNNTLPAASGTSTFRVVIDPNNRVAESNESNNTAQIDFSFLKGGITVLRPSEFAILSGTTPQLVVQSNDPQGTSRVYEFELDTTAAFNGTTRRTTVTAGVVAQWAPTVPATLGGRDSLVWYWRARFQTPQAGEDGNWVVSSFRVIPGSPGGWSQSHYAQFKRDTRTNVDVNAPNGRWSFVNTRIPIVLRTKGGGVAGTAAGFSSVTGGGIYIQSAAGLPSVSGCGVQSPNLLIAVYNGASLRPVAMPAGFQRCGQAPDYFYYFSAPDLPNPANVDPLDNLNSSATRQGLLDAFLTAIPDGSYVAVVSANRLTYSTLPAALKGRIQALLGSQLITTLADGEPLTLLGQKLTATTGRLIHERGPDRSSATTIPTVSQLVELRDTLQRPSSAGRIVSTRIGPSQQWLSLYHTIRNPLATGQRTLSVVAIDTLGRETVVLPNVTASGRTGQALTTLVPARTYPYLRLELAVADTVTRIPPQLRQWLVTSRGLPEGVVRRDAVAASNYTSATLTRQAVDSGYVRFPVRFENISDEAFVRPLQTRVSLRDVNTRTVVATALITSPGLLSAGAALTVPVRLDVRNRFGTFVVEVVVNPRLQPEQNYSNNELILEQFTVVDTNVPPTLDVAFDGRHILNGELVSSQPVINIQLSDESRLTHITNPSAFTVSLRRPGQTGLPTMVNLNGSEVRFSVDSTKGSVARLIYEPAKSGPLPDGVYELRVQGRDPSNAAAGSQDFQVKFEVVNSSQISNVYPYPNPIVSKARFVFTLTGQTLPTNLKIQIMSLTGRVVREIFMSELGPLHIGNNITDFAWDGTDTYGDRLANGTYLYRVALDDAGGQFSHRDTAGDKAFKNDWGKLVLMR